MPIGAELIEEYLPTVAPASRGVSGYYLRQCDRGFGLVRAAEEPEGWKLIAEWLPVGRSLATQGTYHSVLNRFYEWAERSNTLPGTPIRMIDRPKPPKVEAQHVGILEDEMERVLSLANDAMVRVGLLFARYAGCTQQELAAFTRDDLEVENGQGWLKIHGGKNASRRVPVSDDIVRAIDESGIVAGEPLWIGLPSEVGRKLNQFLQGEVDARLYNLRHQYGYDVFSETGDIFSVRDRLGIASLDGAAEYMVDWRQVEARNDLEFRLSFWKDIQVDGAYEIDPDTVKGLVESDPPPAGVPRFITVTTALTDMTDNELVHYGTAAELAGLRVAFVAGVPVNVALPSNEKGLDVRLGWVESVARDAGVALIALGEQPPELSGFDDVGDVATTDRAERFELRKARPGQARFKFRVLERYGAQCAACGVNHPSLLDAAHIRPWIERGSDHPGNGLALCPWHHRAFDAGLWAIEPESLAVLPRPAGPTLSELLIARQSLAHLSVAPRSAELLYSWDRRWTAGRREGDLVAN